MFNQNNFARAKKKNIQKKKNESVDQDIQTHNTL